MEWFKDAKLGIFYSLGVFMQLMEFLNLGHFNGRISHELKTTRWFYS